MKRSLNVLLIAAACAFSYACATYPRSGPAAVVGTWTNSFGTVWTMNSNGAFEVDLDHDGKRDAWGTCKVGGDTITILGTGGKMPSDCRDKGTYRFTRGRDTLRFTRVHDDCQLRVKNVLLVWHRK